MPYTGDDDAFAIDIESGSVLWEYEARDEMPTSRQALRPHLHDLASYFLDELVD